MTKKQKALKIVLIAIISCIFTASIVFAILAIVNANTPKHDYKDALPTKNKVILFIGDGMGENHIEIAKTYLGRNMCFDGFTYNGYVTTASKELFSPTDSAAAATALATGQKVNNGAIARENGKNITSITELSKAKNIGVGIVTTDSLFGATPAGFSAHANNRGDVKEIIESQLLSNIDIFLGAGVDKYLPYKTQFESKGYLFTNSFSNLNLKANKVFGTFSSIANGKSTNETPTLEELTEFAVNFLEEKYPDGYFLMVEGAHIDKMSHKNKMLEMIEYLDEFDKSIAFCRQKFANDRDMALIVTADHETGNLQKFSGTKQDINDSLFTNDNHSNQDVRYYIQLCGIKQAISDMPQKIDNTDIFRICSQFMQIEKPSTENSVEGFLLKISLKRMKKKSI